MRNFTLVLLHVLRCANLFMRCSSFSLPKKTWIVFVTDICGMDYQQDAQGKGKGIEAKLPPISSPFFYEAMAPPSYHSFDGIWADTATRPKASFEKEFHHRGREHGAGPRHQRSRHEELTINHRPREDRRKHHRPRRSSSHNHNGTAKLVFQGLKSNLFGSGSTGENGRDSKRRAPVSRTTKLDFCSNNRDIHYTVHNHWHDPSPSESISRTRTWPCHESGSDGPQPITNFMSGALPAFTFGTQYANQRMAGGLPCQDHSTSFDGLFSGFSPPVQEELDQSSVWGIFSHWPRRPSHDAACRYPAYDSLGTGHSEPAKEMPHSIPEWCRHCPDSATHHDSTTQPSFSHDTESRHSSKRSNSKNGRLDAASALSDYNKHWDYIDTVQQPYPHELPWPTIRPNVPFDHMKCDVFSFFAQAYGLRPDRRKAPKLDFKLSPRSPYPSYDQRQQECERKMLKMFKQQMQREKLRWHEDKLRRKFPDVVGRGSSGERDDEKRKAVWAAIAEGSAVCDKRLGSMF